LSVRKERVDVTGDLLVVLEQESVRRVRVDLHLRLRDQAGEQVGEVRQDHRVAVAVGHEDGHADRADALQPTGRLDGIDLSSSGETVRALAETTLALVLFSDASRIDLGALRRTVGMPVRLLGIGLPLTIALGAAAAAAVFGELTMGEALILAVVLAPTDAALGQAVVTEPRVPRRIRPALNVESGLNDGICVPLLPVAVAMWGSHARGPTVGFVGWFAPRGLASMVFAVIVVEESSLPHETLIVRASYLTVGLSVLVHGLTAAPLADRYARWYEQHPREKAPPMEGAPAEVTRPRGPAGHAT
jgi:NhaP-type Na+/H+ or K+/H+ antiporter